MSVKEQVDKIELSQEGYYWDIKPILSVGAVYNMVYSARGPGKSYGVKKFTLEEFMKEVDNDPNTVTHRILYLRRYELDVKPVLVEGYFKDMTLLKKGNKEVDLMTITGGRFNHVKAAKNMIFLSHMDNKGKETDIKQFGYYDYIGNAERIKSVGYPDVSDIIIEEYIASSKPYLPNECELVESIVSTVCRERKVRVWFIGNNDSRDCIYYRYFGLNNIKKQKENTIDVYHKLTGEYNEDGTPEEVLFAVEFAQKKNKKPGMFFGNGAKINDSGEWKSHIQPKLSQQKAQEGTELLVINFKLHGFEYWARYYLDEKTGGRYWYVVPKTKPYYGICRVISDEVSIDPLHTINLNGLNELENMAFKDLINGKVWYSDDLTGEEFLRAVEFFNGNNIITNKSII